MFDYKKSDYFWGAILTIILCYLCSLHAISFFIIEALLSASLIAFLIHNSVEYDFSYSSKPKYIKIPIFYIISPVAILGLIVWGIIWIINNPVKKFNTWLNTEKEKKLKFKEFTKKETK